MLTRRGALRLVPLAALLMVCPAAGCTLGRAEKPESYCAQLHDSVGLYAGNPVTQMGYKIGKVDEVIPGDLSTTVRFTLSQPRRLPADVGATIRSNNVLADRSLELVGNYRSGPELAPGQCIDLARTATPKSLSEIMDANVKFFGGIAPNDSDNVSRIIDGLDKLTQNNGPKMNQLLTRTSVLLDNPDRVVAELGESVKNLRYLTGTVDQLRGPLKASLLSAAVTTGDMSASFRYAGGFITPIGPVLQMIEDIEITLGDAIQITLDTVTVAVRKLAPHANSIAHGLDAVPWWINWVANQTNNHQFNLQYRPPRWRVRTPDGWLLCGVMNAESPGSCANVAGQPYSADVDMLTYVFQKAVAGR